MMQNKQEYGQATTEYALLLVLVGGIVVAALAWLGQGVYDSFREVNECIAGVKYALINSSFEDGPQISRGWRPYNSADITGWETTATDNKIEVWYTGFLGVNAPDGRYLVELNANQPSALYQDIDSVPGERLTWSFFHRGRAGTDVMELRIGAPGATIVEEEFATGREWVKYSGLYEVPEGQTETRFEFAAVRTATGNLSVGNLLDNIQFGSPCGYEEEAQAE
ncbi:MAG: hypothetical protein DHS20C20_10520 [Ardenticatenaceae bacterium]|nr:MAG: hypothetical protein DHS20C20_10520 [Ardenticatenaceae bacterium]